MTHYKKMLPLAIVLVSGAAAAQSNTFPPNGNVGIGTSNPQDTLDTRGNISLENDGGSAFGPILNMKNFGGYGVGSIDFYTYSGQTVPSARWQAADVGGFTADHVFFTSLGGSGNQPLVARVIIKGSSGNVGIGTTSPGAALEINGNIKLTSGTGASMTYPDGTVQATAWNGVLTGGDYAESVNVAGDRASYEPGDVLVINPEFEGGFLKSSVPYSTSVTGIYSTKPGVVGRRQHTAREHMKEEVPMAMTGIVPTKVSAENGPVKPGDLLVSSSKAGYAMKGTDRDKMLGAVIGKAIGHLDSGVGVIEAVVTLQ
jgi:hypothetical protein